MDNDEMLVVIKDMFDAKIDEVKLEVQTLKRHNGVLFEKLESDIKAIAEGHDNLNMKMDTVIKDVKELKTDVDVLKMEVNIIKTDVNTLKTDVNTLKTDVNTLKTEMNIVKDYVIGVDTKLNEHEIILKRVK